MDLDPRLQNLSAADLQDFTVPHYPNFDQGYQSALYDNGLGEDHGAQGHPQTHTHTHPYAQYVTNPAEATHFEGTGTSPARLRPNNNNAVNHGRHLAAHARNGRTTNPRSGRHIAQRTHPPQSQQQQQQQQQQPPLQHQQFTNQSFTSPNTVIPINKAKRIQHAPVARASPTSPLAQRTPKRIQQQQQQQQQQSHPVPSLQPPIQQSRPPSKTPSQTSDSRPQIHTPTRLSSNSTPTTSNITNNNKSSSDNLPTHITQTPTTASTSDPSQFTHPSTFPLIPNPPNLPQWREKFFDITEPLLLTSEGYHTYFPHVDNIYSHRSTQKYKKKPFVSHYWDCRLKGRPTGTPLSKLRARKEGREEEPPVNAPAAEQSQQANSAGGDADGDGDKDVKKRKRKTRERDLCDVKIKVTEFFGRDELEALGKFGTGDQQGGADDGDDSVMDNMGGSTGGGSSRTGQNGQLTFVLEDGTSTGITLGSLGTRLSGQAGASGGIGGSGGGGNEDAMAFGVLEPLKKLPAGHPGAEGKRWYMVQRVNGSGKDDDDASLDHKHTLEESDRIKKNSVQRWMLAQEKERKKFNRNKPTTEGEAGGSNSRTASTTSTPSHHASGKAQQTAKSHASPATTEITFYANSFCPYAQRIWIALELKGIPYQYVEVTPSQMKDGKCTIPSLLEVCPEGNIPTLQHGNWAVWESDVVLEYLEDLSIGHSLLPLGNPQLRAHCRLWKDHINRKILPYFYALLLLPTSDPVPANGQPEKPPVTERRSTMVSTLQDLITQLVNASHATGPFFLGAEISFVDVAFAPWIIRLSRVLEYYREFPKPEVGTRWKSWVDAVESNDAVRRTVSDEKSYHAVYGGIGKDSRVPNNKILAAKVMSEMRYAQKSIRQEGFGLGGDVWGTILPSEAPGGGVQL